jgi:hypothetical protein
MATFDPAAQDRVPPDYPIEAITLDEARAFIKEYEYLGTLGHPRACYGARDPFGELAAVASFGAPAFTQDKRVIVLERGACAPWAHRHTASWFIPKACAMASRDHGWQIFKAFADPDAGELGTIYQACGWTYCGQGRENGRARDYFRHVPSGREITEHAFRARGLKVADVDGIEWERVKKAAKHVYVHVVAPRGQKKKLLATFPNLPYPKRA